MWIHVYSVVKNIWSTKYRSIEDQIMHFTQNVSLTVLLLEDNYIVVSKGPSSVPGLKTSNNHVWQHTLFVSQDELLILAILTSLLVCLVFVNKIVNITCFICSSRDLCVCTCSNNSVRGCSSAFDCIRMGRMQRRYVIKLT